MSTALLIISAVLHSLGTDGSASFTPLILEEPNYNKS